MSNYTELENEVRADMAADPVYPWGEPDMRRWAVAFRLVCERRGNPPLDDEDMFGWFANVCCMGEDMASGTGPLNADGMQSVIDGEAVDTSKYFRRWRGE